MGRQAGRQVAPPCWRPWSGPAHAHILLEEPWGFVFKISEGDLVGTGQGGAGKCGVWECYA
eukprot:472238-Pelagomonas_calceolata.AAC.5